MRSKKIRAMLNRQRWELIRWEKKFSMDRCAISARKQ
jgi:hypothetical protein